MKAKKYLAIALAMGLTVSSFTGCGKKTDNKPNETPVTQGEDKGEKDQAEELPGLLVSKEPVDLSIHLHIYNKFVYTEDWVPFKKAAELTNVTLKGVAPESATDSEQVFNIMMVSGDLPDIITAERQNFFKYGPEGAFIPLNDLIDEHAPNFKQFLEEREDVRRYLTAPDGNIYSINFIPDGAAAQGYFIRTDWLEKLNLPVPKDVDELYTVLKAFREQDPNGNGKKDEIPFIDRAKGQKTIALATLWGAHTTTDRDEWYVEDGKVKFGPMESSYQLAMENLQKWYAEGLIDPEAFTRGAKARDILLGDNIGGFAHDWFGTTAGYNDMFKDKIEGFDFQPIAPPADINGKAWEYSSRPLVNPTGWGISKDNKDPITTIKYLDFWWSEEGRRLMNFGIEGEHYDLVDGKPIFKDHILNSDKPVTQALQDQGIQMQVGFHQDFFYEEQWLNPIAREGMNMYIENGYIQTPFPTLGFTPEEQKIIDEKSVSIYTHVTETTQKWILGAEDPTKTWENYLKALDNMGMQELLEVYQAAYDRFINN
ncbi:MAG: extracellular solute-binding protein [Epulopiscium sp.]|nr:extracellular solute-binding protein [Candidatus Epulonipiscium sp.]